MFNPNYTSLLRRINPQTFQQNPTSRITDGGFGTHFKDTPPTFISDVKKDNKIERIKKPKKKKKPKPKIKYQE